MSLVLQPRFTCHRELLTHLFNNKGIELSLVKSAVFNNNVSLLTEIVCFILDRPGYPNHVQDLEAGSRCAELASISFLGINQGTKPLDNQYNILFYLLSLSKPAEVLDFFRILRSKTDWTSQTFRQALSDSPLLAYSTYVNEKLVSVTPARRHFFTLAFVTALCFNKESGDNLNRWLHTEEPEADILMINPSINPASHYQTVEHIYNEIFRNGIGGVNTDLYESLLAGDSTILKSAPDYEIEGFPNDEECETMPFMARSAFLRFDTFALSYLSLFSNDYEIAQLKKEAAKDDTTVERKAEIEATIGSYNLLRADYSKLFKWLINRFGVDLCSITEIISVYLCAKVYGDVETQKLMKEVAGIDDDNYLTYDHTVRIKFMKDVNMLDGIDKAKASPEDQDALIRTLLEYFIRRNLIKGAEYLLKLVPDKTLQQLAGESNFIALTASTAVAHLSTMKWLMKNKAKLCTNSKQQAKNNIFVCSLFSLGSPESRLAMMDEAFQFAKRNTAYKPEVTPDEFFEAARMSWSSANWLEKIGMRLDMLEFALTNLVPTAAWEKLQQSPTKLLQSIANSISPDLFSISDFTLYSPDALQFLHNQMLRYIKLVLPQNIAGRVVGDKLFKRVMQIAFSFKNVPLFAYLLSFGPKLELNEFIGLAQTSSGSFDYRDLITINSPTFDIDSPDSELALGFKDFSVHSYSLAQARTICGEIVDVDYADLDIVKEIEQATEKNPNMTKEEQQLLKNKLYGSAARHGIRDVDWDAFDPENQSVVVGGDSYEHDGGIEPYMDDANDKTHLSTPEFKKGVDHMMAVFTANNAKPLSLRSPFLSLFELMFNSLGNLEDDVTCEQEFGELFIDPANLSVLYVTGHYLFYSIIRELFPQNTLNIPLFSQLYAAQAIMSSWNRRVWQDDYLVDAIIQIMGATDHAQVTAMFENWTAFSAENTQTAGYIAARAELMEAMASAEETTHEALTLEASGHISGEHEPDHHPIRPITSTKFDLPVPYDLTNPLHTTPTNTVWNITQYILTEKPFVYNTLGENLITSLLFAITFGYCSVVGSAMYRGQQQFEQQCMQAHRKGEPMPPPPASFCPPQFALDSVRVFTIMFNQIKWVPQIFLKLAIVQFETAQMQIIADLYDAFLTHGGKLYQPELEMCRMFPAHYPILLRPDRMDKLYGYYQYVVETIHGMSLEEIEAAAEKQTQKFKDMLEQNDAQDASISKIEHSKPNPQEIASKLEKQNQQHHATSTSSYVAPVLIAVGAALVGLAGYFMYSGSSQGTEASDASSKPKKNKR